LVCEIARNPAFELKGLQCYAGDLQHLESYNERRAKSLAALADLASLCRSLESEGIAPEIVSGGGTGTFDIDAEARILTELQVGSYVFMDRQYNEVWEKSGGRAPFATSLFVQTTVISANRDGLATTDAGFKAFATDAGVPVIVGGAPAGASYFFFGDEQGGILYPSERENCSRAMSLSAPCRTAIRPSISMIVITQSAATVSKRSGRSRARPVGLTCRQC